MTTERKKSKYAAQFAITEKARKRKRTRHLLKHPKDEQAKKDLVGKL
jgi:hypothetical protein